MCLVSSIYIFPIASTMIRKWSSFENNIPTVYSNKLKYKSLYKIILPKQLFYYNKYGTKLYK